ncbi:hypothetical protein O181_097060 [Austropuccinia psidii MF-1]|uniref:Uncharacterized protein n=1 Tax=Austropuccinia psidii MF-1 TaxID=1389203 RepID=A0A9Q3PDK6_9BASI|nr:hypothetical protein [Austropuccinia psidii MF-1]
MNSNYNKSSSSYGFEELSEPNLLQVVNQQYEHIRQLKLKMNRHDQNLEALLHPFNLQENAIKNVFVVSKAKGKQIQRFHSKSFNQPTLQKEHSHNLLAKNQNTKLKTTPTPNEMLQKQISTPPQKQSPNQLLQSEITEAFQPINVT